MSNIPSNSLWMMLSTFSLSASVAMTEWAVAWLCLSNESRDCVLISTCWQPPKLSSYCPMTSGASTRTLVLDFKMQRWSRAVELRNFNAIINYFVRYNSARRTLAQSHQASCTVVVLHYKLRIWYGMAYNTSYISTCSLKNGFGICEY